MDYKRMISYLKEIKEKWVYIKTAIESKINLLKSFGFTDSTMTSYLATIPISYYIYNGGDIKSEISKSQIRKYITIALINQRFGRASNSVIIPKNKPPPPNVNK